MKVFLSYSRRDADFVDRLDQALTKGGYDVLVDRSDIAGDGEDRWRRSIAKAIRDSDTVVLVLSPNSTASESVERELSVAADSRRRVVPVIYRECELPDGFAYELAGIQHVDFTDGEFGDAARQLMAQLGPPNVQLRRFDEVQPAAEAPPGRSTAAPGTSSSSPVTQEVAIDAAPSRPPHRRWLAVAIGAGAVALVGIIIALLTLGGGGDEEAATNTTAGGTLAPLTTAPPPVATTPAAPTSSTLPPDQRAVALVDEWAAATSRRDWATAARIDNSGTIRDYDERYGRPQDSSHMERVEVYVDRVGAYDTAWLVKGAVMARDASAARGPSTNVVCSYWIVDLNGHTAAWNEVEPHRLRPAIEASAYPDAYARYCT
jgi:hypothetical protein